MGIHCDSTCACMPVYCRMAYAIHLTLYLSEDCGGTYAHMPRCTLSGPRTAIIGRCEGILVSKSIDFRTSMLAFRSKGLRLQQESQHSDTLQMCVLSS